MTNKNQEMTEIYTSFGGNKLLQHTDVLKSIQIDKKFRPIMIELCPTEVCDSDCPFCSVAGRPLKSYMPFAKIKKVLEDFKSLGAKSIEITGGGNPLLYRDKETKNDINDVIRYAYGLGYEVGFITNSHNLKLFAPDVHDMISWLRISLIQLDEGRAPEDYNFHGFPAERMGFSYIIYETGGIADPLSRTKKAYQGTNAESIKRIAKLIELHPGIKFARIYGNCLDKGGHPYYKSKFEDVVAELDKYGKMFIKEIGYDDGPHDDACYIGMLRPYIAPNPRGGDYQVYTCNSFVLNTRTYDLDYSLCCIDDVIPAWEKMNKNYQEKGYPYEVKGNKGCGWIDTCKYCYYQNSNKLLHEVGQEIPDKNFI